MCGSLQALCAAIWLLSSIMCDHIKRLANIQQRCAEGPVVKANCPVICKALFTVCTQAYIDEG